MRKTRLFAVEGEVGEGRVLEEGRESPAGIGSLFPPLQQGRVQLAGGGEKALGLELPDLGFHSLDLSYLV